MYYHSKLASKILLLKLIQVIYIVVESFCVYVYCKITYFNINMLVT